MHMGGYPKFGGGWLVKNQGPVPFEGLTSPSYSFNTRQGKEILIFTLWPQLSPRQTTYVLSKIIMLLHVCVCDKFTLRRPDCHRQCDHVTRSVWILKPTIRQDCCRQSQAKSVRCESLKASLFGDLNFFRRGIAYNVDMIRNNRTQVLW